MRVQKYYACNAWNPTKTGEVRVTCSGCAAPLGMDARNVSMVKRLALAIVCENCAFEAMDAADEVFLHRGDELREHEKAASN